MDPIWRPTYPVYRIPLPVTFLFSGPGKLPGIPTTGADIPELGLPFPKLSAEAADALDRMFGALLVLGLKAGRAATDLLPFKVPTAAVFEHPFRGHEVAPTVIPRNLANMGGLLTVAPHEVAGMRSDQDSKLVERWQGRT